MTSPPSTPVRNVNDKPTGSARLIGSAVEDSALVVDTSSIADEDGIGGFDITWQRSFQNLLGLPAGQNEVLRLTQNKLAILTELLLLTLIPTDKRSTYTSPSETIDNLTTQCKVKLIL